MSLLTSSELKEKYGSSYELGSILNVPFNNDEEYYTQVRKLKEFIQYSLVRFSHIQGSQIFKETDYIFNMIKNGSSDYDVYSYIKKFQIDIDPRQREKSQYEFTTAAKVYQLKLDLYNAHVPIPSIKKVLDIGTERLEFLDSIVSVLGLDTNQAIIKGINIDTGFCHYDECFDNNTTDPRFQKYDGINIPFTDNEFDLITMYSVVHHIPPKDFEIVAKDIYRVCNGYLHIKDVDLTSTLEQVTFRVQHYAYQGIFTPGGDSYMNDKATILDTVKVLTSVGFKVVSLVRMNNFNKSYHILLKKEKPILDSIQVGITKESGSYMVSSIKAPKCIVTYNYQSELSPEFPHEIIINEKKYQSPYIAIKEGNDIQSTINLYVFLYQDIYKKYKNCILKGLYSDEINKAISLIIRPQIDKNAGIYIYPVDINKDIKYKYMPITKVIRPIYNVKKDGPFFIETKPIPNSKEEYDVFISKDYPMYPIYMGKYGSFILSETKDIDIASILSSVK